MQTEVFAIFDKKAAIFSPPFYAPHKEIAIRNVAMAARNLDSQLGQYPSDFALYALGTFDDHSAQFETGVPKFVVEVVGLVPVDTQLPLFSGEREAAE